MPSDMYKCFIMGGWNEFQSLFLYESGKYNKELLVEGKIYILKYLYMNVLVICKRLSFAKRRFYIMMTETK